MTKQRLVILVLAALMALGISIASNTQRVSAEGYGGDTNSFGVICRTCAY